MAIGRQNRQNPTGSPSRNMDIDLIQKLISVMDENGLTELHYEQEGTVVRLSRQSGSPASSVSAETPPAALLEAAGTPSQPLEEEGVFLVRSPLVGTFYRRPNPDADWFVTTGDDINEATVLCVIEAMKVFNEIKAECSGSLLEILLEDGDPVEFDQPMFRVKIA